MLDLNHPQTRFVFDASVIEDKIRERIVEMRTATSTARHALAGEILRDLVPALHRLNADHFGNSGAIARTLNELADALETIDEVERIWAAFLRLAEEPGDNFGTWAI